MLEYVVLASLLLVTAYFCRRYYLKTKRLNNEINLDIERALNTVDTRKKQRLLDRARGRK